MKSYTEYKNLWYKKNKDRILQMRRDYYAVNREKILVLRAEDRKNGIAQERKWKSRGANLTFSEYQEAYQTQKGKCLACGREDGDKTGRKLCADHDHETGEFRGLLCVGCNFHDALGVS